MLNNSNYTQDRIKLIEQSIADAMENLQGELSDL